MSRTRAVDVSIQAVSPADRLARLGSRLGLLVVLPVLAVTLSSPGKAEPEA